MENRRGSGIFLSVIGVATLVVAIIGATFAYFSATANSENEAISVGSTELSLGYKDILTGLKTNMIPSTKEIAHFAATDPTWITMGEFKDPQTQEVIDVGMGQCIDDNNNQICSVYEFYIGNPSTTTDMEIEGYFTLTANEFTNLKYAIYDESGTEVTEGTFPTLAEGETKDVSLAALNQKLVAYEHVAVRTDSDDLDVVVDFSTKGEGETMLNYAEDNPMTYQPSLDMSLTTNRLKETNVRHYTMMIWINEINSNQADMDAGKIFTAGITFKTGGETGGITGIIAVANDSDGE